MSDNDENTMWDDIKHAESRMREVFNERDIEGIYGFNFDFDNNGRWVAYLKPTYNCHIDKNIMNAVVKWDEDVVRAHPVRLSGDVEAFTAPLHPDE